MTVAELREQLAQLPDYYRVVIEVAVDDVELSLIDGAIVTSDVVAVRPGGVTTVHAVVAGGHW